MPRLAPPVIAALAGALLLSACSAPKSAELPHETTPPTSSGSTTAPASTSPSGTADPQPNAVPESEKEAVSSAYAFLGLVLKNQERVLGKSKEDPQLVYRYVAGPMAAEYAQIIPAMKKNGSWIEGAPTLRLISGKASPGGGQKSGFGLVELTVCRDASTIKSFTAQGQQAKNSGPAKTKGTEVVSWDSSKNNWVWVSHTSQGEPC